MKLNLFKERKRSDINLDSILENVSIARNIEQMKKQGRDRGEYIPNLMKIYADLENGEYKRVLRKLKELIFNHDEVSAVNELGISIFENPPETAIGYSDLCIIGARIARALGKTNQARKFVEKGCELLEDKSMSLAVGYAHFPSGDEKDKYRIQLEEQLSVYRQRQDYLKNCLQ